MYMSYLLTYFVLVGIKIITIKIIFLSCHETITPVLPKRSPGKSYRNTRGVLVTGQMPLKHEHHNSTKAKPP